MRARTLVLSLLAAAAAVWFFLTARPANGPGPAAPAPEASDPPRAGEAPEAPPRPAQSLEPFIGPRPGGLTMIPGTVSAEPPADTGSE